MSLRCRDARATNKQTQKGNVLCIISYTSLPCPEERSFADSSGVPLVAEPTRGSMPSSKILSTMSFFWEMMA